MLNYSAFSIAALLLSIISVTTLYFLWSQRHSARTKQGEKNTADKHSQTLTHHALLKLAAWCGIASSPLLWAQDIGAEFAIVFTCLVVGVSAWGCIVWESRYARRLATHRWPLRSNALKVVEAQKYTAGKLLKTNVVIVAGPIACLSAAFTSLALTHFLNMSLVNQLALSGFLFPFLWSLLALWANADPVWWRPGLINILSPSMIYLVLM